MNTIVSVVEELGETLFNARLTHPASSVQAESMTDGTLGGAVGTVHQLVSRD